MKKVLLLSESAATDSEHDRNRRMNPKTLTISIILLFLPIVFAFDCGKFQDQQFCENITSSNLSQSDQDGLLAAALYGNPEFPNHQFVENWNENIIFSAAPDGVQTYNQGAIRDAWFKIIAVMPSVIDTKLHTPGYGKIQSAYNYRIETPSGTMSGDCATYYYLDVNQSMLDILINNIHSGSTNLVSYTAPYDMNFSAVLNLKSVIRKEHYQTERYCCQTYRGRCIRYCYRCVYRYTDYITDQLQLTDNLNASYYNPDLKINLSITNNFDGTTYGKLDQANATSFGMSTQDSYFSKSFYDYSFEYSFPPYDVLYIMALKHNTTEIRNANANEINSSYYLIFADSENCSLWATSYFSSINQSCNLSFQLLNLTIKTDKLDYLDNETIKVNVTPDNEFLTLSYSNISEEIKGSATLKAVFPFNRIILSSGEIKTEKVIAVRKKDSTDFFINLSVFSSVIYFGYLGTRKYAGVFL